MTALLFKTEDKKMVELSIVIVNFNTKQLTLSCIDSIFKSNPKVLFEVIVVDNASSDGSREVLQKIKSEKVRLVFLDQNFGFAKGNNRGIEKAKGQYILLLNSDTVVKKGAIDTLYNFAKHTPDVGLVVPKLLNKDGSVQGSVFRDPTLKRAILQYWFGKKGLLDKYAPKTNEPLSVEVAVAACMLITPAVIKKVGLLNESYFMYFEDFDYCRRVRRAGFEIYYLPEAEIVHYHGESGKNEAAESDQWRRLIPSSKIYHGAISHYMISFVIWTGQKWQKLLRK